MQRFGFTVNSKGYKVLPPQIRVIQGDGINFESTKQIIDAMKEQNQSIDNVTFGMGGGLLQKVDRDVLKFAFKCSAVKVGGEWRDVFKQPIDAPFKISKKGRLKLIQVDGEFKTVREEEMPECENMLETVFENGYITRTEHFDAVRKRAEVTF